MALDFLAGCLGGCAGVLVGHPMDTVKVHLQTQDSKNPKYRGTFDCFRKILKKDSFPGLYRGITSPLGGVSIVNAIVFGVYGNVQRNASEPNSLKSHFIAGSTAGLAQSLICSPMELAKTRLQIQENYSTNVKFKGPLECLRHVFRTEGTRGLFRGLGVTAMRDVPGFSSYFVSYELIMRQFEEPTAFHTLMVGGLAGTISWLFTFPIDVVKSSIQADGIVGERKFTGFMDCARKGFKSEGISFFCRGLTSTLLRAFPMNAATFMVVSWVLNAAERFQIGFEVRPFETLAVIGSSVPINHPNTHIKKYLEDDSHVERNERRSDMIKSLVYSGTFTEAVGHSEMVELANDLHSIEQPYYLFDDHRITTEIEQNKGAV